MISMEDVKEGAAFEAKYPFVREPYTYLDADGWVETMTWKPGVLFEGAGEHGESAIAVADGEGTIILCVVSVHKPGRFPTRVFFVRQWKDPNGRVFGKTACRVVTLEKFRRIASGYQHRYEVDYATGAGTPEQLAQDQINERRAKAEAAEHRKQREATS